MNVDNAIKKFGCKELPRGSIVGKATLVSMKHYANDTERKKDIKLHLADGDWGGVLQIHPKRSEEDKSDTDKMKSNPSTNLNFESLTFAYNESPSYSYFPLRDLYHLFFPPMTPTENPSLLKRVFTPRSNSDSFSPPDQSPNFLILTFLLMGDMCRLLKYHKMDDFLL
ncbi:MAG: hypothetical protein KatS3mg002_0135 [Candidatus Woesearchaeota archaeon]|nr:MAG: hypothetical protein KatS3mg002_0135 [Candidatus Woesearchaeota archaeon]